MVILMAGYQLNSQAPLIGKQTARIIRFLFYKILPYASLPSSRVSNPSPLVIFCLLIFNIILIYSTKIA